MRNLIRHPLFVRILLGLAAAAMVIVALIAVGMAIWWRLQPVPADWVARTVPAVTAEADSPDWVAGKLDSGDWLDLTFVMFQNGEWIAFRHACGKESGEARIGDMFLGRASDGKWYWSRYHFCINMLTLAWDEQPASLAGFVHTYHLNPIADPYDTVDVGWKIRSPGPADYGPPPAQPAAD